MKIYYETSDSLIHYGVKGQKWGVRRYQNPDGTLTAKGKKRYDKISDDKLQKVLYKQVKKARAKQTDWSDQWNVSNTIGNHSKKAQDEYNKAWSEHTNSEAYKKAEKKFKKLEDDYWSGKIDHDKFNDEWVKVQETIYKPELDRSVRISSDGRKYVNEYLKTYGKDLNIGYLKDLGYNEAVSKELTERILRANKKLLNGM